MRLVPFSGGRWASPFLPAVSTLMLKVLMCSTQAVLGPVLESLPQGVSIRPAHLWLLEAPFPCVRECEWWVLALSALSAMPRFQRQLAQGGVA